MKWQDVQTVLNTHDPMALLRLGAPEDEYHSEAKTISRQVYPDITEDALSEIVFSTFRAAFAYDGDHSLVVDNPTTRGKCRKIAADIQSICP